MESEATPRKKSSSGLAAIFLSIAIVAILAFFALTNLSTITSIFNLGNSTTTVPVTSSYIGSGNFTLGYPSNYNFLANYALSLINTDRMNYGVSNVTLSPIVSAQEHAYSMYENGYFSHWDVNGYKPYMRYSLLNGTGAVEENVAFESTSSVLGTFTNTLAEETAIKNLEYDMVYNDSACCQNGHLLNIINPYHNRVSIGIMYGSDNIYFVEDFENYYIDLNSSSLFVPSTDTVTLKGASSISLNPDTVVISWDPLPTSLSPSVLDSVYQRPYDEGTFLGGVIPCSNGVFCTTQFSGNTITIQPETWDVTSSSVTIVFSLVRFIEESGSGVYTIYLTQNTFASNPNETESLTSISLFINA